MKTIPDKLFFSISEVSELAGIKSYVLRYWESEFNFLSPEKNEAGQRRYRKKDIEMVLRIKELLYEEGYTIAGAKRRLRQESRGMRNGTSLLAPQVLKRELQDMLNILE